MLAVKLYKKAMPWLGRGSHLVPIVKWEGRAMKARVIDASESIDLAIVQVPKLPDGVTAVRIEDIAVKSTLDGTHAMALYCSADNVRGSRWRERCDEIQRQVLNDETCRPSSHRLTQ
jgi:hypothetical protein